MSADGKTLSPLAGQAVVANMMPGRYGIVATPARTALAEARSGSRPTRWTDRRLSTPSSRLVRRDTSRNTVRPVTTWPSALRTRRSSMPAKAGVCNWLRHQHHREPNCTNTLKGMVTSERMSRTPDERLYSSGDYSAFSFTQCYVSFGDPDGEDFAFTKCNADGTFELDGLPDGNWRVTVFDQWDDFLVDGLSTPV